MRALRRCLLPLLTGACLAAAAGPAHPGVGAAAPATADPELAAWRAERRAAVRARSLRALSPATAGKTLLDPAAAPPRFGLLVIPVDFADHRLPAGWDAGDLAPRLAAPDGQSLRHYFAVASGGRCELVPVVAPAVHLAGEAADYSDIGWNGFSRSRRLAGEALQAVADAGFEFRLADLDGPDGRAGSGDDDGWVDGVLLLHAEAGQENDAAHGLVQALQYYLAEPVAGGGVLAGPYAVASLRSGPGIWAHETAHLLGMEDRYDPLLPPATGAAGDLAGAGGLGVFSLMAAGALGTGGGWNPSLPDAYSRALLGWCDVAVTGSSPARADTLRAAPGGAAHRVWTRGGQGPEFFLLELRDPAAAAPFDGALPGRGVVVLHVDESVPEGTWRDDGGGRWHLRAHVVEGDGDDGLRGGGDTGAASDLYGVAGGGAALTPATAPPSDGYGGPSGVALDRFGAAGDAISYHAAGAAAPWVTFTLAFGGGASRALELAATVAGGSATGLAVRLEALGADGWGAFAGGGRSVELDLVPADDGDWRPAAAVAWTPSPGLPEDAVTTFRCTFTGPEVATLTADRTWAWEHPERRLDFAADWPGVWTADQPDGAGTSWRRWTGADSPAAGGAAVLVCTGDGADPAAWPAVSYTNGGRARLTSLPLPLGGGGVRLLHWVDLETLPDGTPMDGAAACWVAPDGSEVPATPVGGWPARVDGGSGSALHGRGSFGGAAGELDPDGRPVWRSAILPAPPGTGPWRLRLEFAANGLWRARGWLVAACEPLTGPIGGRDGLLQWSAADGLAWDWPWSTGTPAPDFTVESRVAPDSTWTVLGTTTSTALPAAWLRDRLGGPADAQQEVRVTGPTAWGTLALGPVLLAGDGGAAEAATFGAPWPNPAGGDVRFALTVPDGATARLRVYDLRGRLVHAREVPTGRWFSRWDGRDDGGRRLPAGTYVLRLEGAGRTVTHKVVLIH